MKKREVKIGPATIGIAFAVFAAGVIRENPFAAVIYLMIAFYLTMLAE